MPNEIQEGDLMGWINGQGNIFEHNEDIQLGMVQLQDSWPQQPSLGPCPEAIRQWVRHFSDNSGNFSSVLIPELQINFFTFLLLQSPTFDQAKSFLQSNAWNHFSSDLSTLNGNATLFFIPHSCPQVDLQICSNFEHTSSAVLESLGEDLGLDTEGSNSKAPDNVTTPKNTPKRKGKAPLSEADVRRSMRLKLINKGFKSSPTS